LKIRVTADNIARGEPCSAGDCALSLAFRDAGFDVSIGPETIDFYNHLKEHVAELLLPPIARDFRQLFDNGHPVAPFEFDMPELIAGLLPITHARSVAVV
jgi:hypothetical protein